ncbi:MAG TPA: polysaccharide pyruvyl transferase family protein [Chloroflexota bacterium]|nr:polysaccharide pyruvyl transferase family protein [Chloroflexota bacterium]
MSDLNVLLMGYNGANNTGAEALLQADIADVRAVLGPDAQLTIPSLNPANLRRYVKETPQLRIAPVSSIYVPELARLVRQQDLVLLVEGSAYMDTWSSALLWAFLWVTHCAHVMRKPCLAYAVDAGQLRPFNQWLVKRVASETDLIVVRSEAAAERLRGWGVTAPIESTADNALTFHPNPTDDGVLQRLWPEATRTSGVAGLVPVDFNLFPVVIRPWGKAEDCYRWPLYFSRTPSRRRASQELAAGYAAVADRLIAQRDLSVALIAYEQLDEPMVQCVLHHMQRPEQARAFSSRELNASQMTSLLRGLDLLVTSRYHACILSLAAAVPQVAVGHDLRLKTLYRELGLEADFVEPGPGMCTRVEKRLDYLLRSPEPARAALRRGYADHLARAQRNRALLSSFVTSHGLPVQRSWQLAA